MKVKDSNVERKGKCGNHLPRQRVSFRQRFQSTTASWILWTSVLFLLCISSQFTLSMTEALKESPRVLIVGSGAAGIAAATKLIDNGVKKVTILESSDRIGGRINYVKTGHGGFDLGAHWVHGQGGNVVYEMANPLGLVTHSNDFDNPLMYIKPNGSIIKFSLDLHEKFYEDVFATDLHIPNATQEEVVTQKFQKFKNRTNLSKEDLDAILRFTLSFLCTIEGCASLNQVSSNGLQSYKVAEGDLLMMFIEGGYNNAIELLLRRHPKSIGPEIKIDKNIKFGKRVSNINWKGDEVVVTCDDKSEFRGDVVIFTPSLGVLKADHTTLFTPPLPEDKTKTIKALGIDVVDKIYLLYEKPWWPLDITGFNFLKYDDSSDQDSWGNDILGFYRQASNPNALCAWMIGSGAKKMENDTEENVKNIAVSVLQKHLGHKYTIPEPVTMLRSKWWTNKDVRGSYSFPTMESDNIESPRQTLTEPLVNNAGRKVVLFAGEATHPNYYSTVHGAVETGWREANRIIDMYKSSK